jgi:PAS domain S-box-containing protein
MLQTFFSSEDLYSSFFESSSICVWIKDAYNNPVKINKAASLLEGEPDGKLKSERLSEEFAHKFWMDNDEVIRTGETKHGIYEAHAIPGTHTIKWLQVNKLPIKDTLGKVIGVMIYAFDVTDIKEAEEQTRRKEEQNQLLMDIAPFPIVISSLVQNRYLYINRAAAQLFETSADVALEKDPGNVFVNKDQHQLLLQKLTRGDNVQDEEVVFRKGNGELVYCLISAVKIQYQGEDCSYSTLKDITSLKNNELKQIRIAEKFRLVFENSNDALFWADAETGEIINCNRSAEELLLFHREDIIGKKHWEIHPVKDRELYEKLFTQVGRTDASGIRLEVQDSRGHIIPVIISISTVNFEDRRIVQAIIRDITQHVESERALKESEEKYRAVVSNAPVVFFEIDKNGNFVLLEGKGLLSFGLFSQNILNKPIDEVFNGYPEYLSQIKKALNGEKLNFTISFSNEVFDTYFSPVSDDNGIVASVIGVAVDITDRRKAEMKLSYEKNLLRTLIDIIPDLIYAKDSESTFLVGNKKVADLFGLKSPEELVGKTDFDFFPIDEANMFYQEEQSLINSQTSIINKVVKTNKGEYEVYHEITKIPFFSPEGKVIGIVGISKDISERIKAEEAIRESEMKYRHMAENMQDVIWQMSADMKFLYLSPSFYQLTGFQPSEFIGKSFWELIAAEAVPVLKKELEIKGLERTQNMDISSLTFITPQIHKEKGVIWAEIAAKPIFDENGELLFYQGIARDITQRKLAEIALKESQEKLSAVITNAPIVLFQMDKDGICHFSDGKGLERLGLKPGEVVGLSAYDFYKDSPEILSQIEAALKGELVRGVVNINNIFFETQYSPVFDQNGEVESVIGMAIDITERKLAEDAFLQSEIKFRTLFLEMTEGVTLNTLVYENGMPVNYRIMEANPAFFKHTGLKECETKELLATELFNTKEPPFFKDYLEVALSGESKKIEAYLDRLDKYFKISVISPAKNNFAVVFEDVSAAKKGEKELKDKNEELERFSYTVSHDLKSPLVTIKGFIGMLEQDLISQNKENIADDIQRIKSATDKMSNLLNDLLELSRIGRIINPPVFVSMNLIINDALELVSGIIKDRGVEVEVREKFPEVYVDKQRMVEVWQNLIENAVKFFGKQQNPKIIISFFKEDAKFIFSITDNGIGIDKKYHSTVFGLFNKLEGKTEGTGIGLALVKRIVEVHGGEIWAESEGLGKGTKFSFTIPAKTIKTKTK